MARSRSAVLWPQVWGLAAAQGAISLAWVIYNLYLLDLLTRMGLPAALAATLLIIENIIGVVAEPLMGNLSDRMLHWVGTRLPLITVGMLLSATLFIAIPAVVVWSSAAWLLPVVLVAWAIAMTVFRSPVLSLLGKYAFSSGMPQAASILTLVGGVASAMGPLAGSAILSVGPPVAFAVGSGVLLGAAALLRRLHGQAPAAAGVADEAALSYPALGLVFATGVGVGFGFRGLMQVFPAVLGQQALTWPVSVILGAMFLALAGAAVPMGRVASRYGSRRTMGVGLVAMALLCALLGFAQTTGLALLLALLLGSCFSLVANGTLPFALSMVPPQKGGLGTGLYFGGGALATSVYGLLTQNVSLPWMQGLAVLAFAMAAVCVGIRQPQPAAQPLPK